MIVAAVAALQLRHHGRTGWLKPLGPGTMPRPQMLRNLAVDADLIGSMQAPGGAVAAHDWRFVLTTPAAVLAAECTHSQVPRLAGVMTPATLPRTCRTSWHTA